MTLSELRTLTVAAPRKESAEMRLAEYVVRLAVEIIGAAAALALLLIVGFVMAVVVIAVWLRWLLLVIALTALAVWLREAIGS